MGVEIHNDALGDGNRPGDPRKASDPPKATIVILDDDDSFREALARLLDSEGYAVVQAVDVAALEHALGKHPVDLIVADSRLPDGDGWAQARVLAARHGVKAVVPVSGYDDADIERTGGQIVDGAVGKGSGRVALLNIIDRQLQANSQD